MKPPALIAAQARIESASDALARMEKAVSEWNWSTFAVAWVDFLIASNGVYAKLEQGGKRCQRSKKWFEAIKEIRRNDELLNYMHKARNTEEHTIDSTSKSIDYIDMYPLREDVTIVRDSDGKATGANIPEGLSLGEPLVQLIGPDAFLKEIYDRRSGKTLKLPNYHLNEPMPDQHPITASRLTLAYLVRLISEARVYEES